MKSVINLDEVSSHEQKNFILCSIKRVKSTNNLYNYEYFL
jgi:hypothetical protein